MKILIVEDDPINITLAKDTLTMFDSNIEIPSIVFSNESFKSFLRKLPRKHIKKHAYLIY